MLTAKQQVLKKPCFEKNIEGLVEDEKNYPEQCSPIRINFCDLIDLRGTNFQKTENSLQEMMYSGMSQPTSQLFKNTKMEHLGSESMPHMATKNNSVRVNSLKELKKCARDPSVYLKRCIAINKTLETDNGIKHVSPSMNIFESEVFPTENKIDYDTNRNTVSVSCNFSQNEMKYALTSDTENKGTEVNKLRSGDKCNISPNKIKNNIQKSQSTNIASNSVIDTERNNKSKYIETRTDQLQKASSKTSLSSDEMNVLEEKKNGIVKVIISGENFNNELLINKRNRKINEKPGPHLNSKKCRTITKEEKIGKNKLNYLLRKQMIFQRNYNRKNIKKLKKISYNIRKRNREYVKQCNKILSPNTLTVFEPSNDEMLDMKIKDSIEDSTAKLDTVTVAVTNAILDVLLGSVQDGYLNSKYGVGAMEEYLALMGSKENILKNNYLLRENMKTVYQDNKKSSIKNTSSDRRNNEISSEVSGTNKQSDVSDVFTGTSTLASYCGSETSSEKSILPHDQRKIHSAQRHNQTSTIFGDHSVPKPKLNYSSSGTSCNDSVRDFDFGDTPVFDIIQDPPTAVSRTYFDLGNVSETSCKSSVSSKPPPHPGSQKKVSTENRNNKTERLRKPLTPDNEVKSCKTENKIIGSQSIVTKSPSLIKETNFDLHSHSRNIDKLSDSAVEAVIKGKQNITLNSNPFPRNTKLLSGSENMNKNDQNIQFSRKKHMHQYSGRQIECMSDNYLHHSEKQEDSKAHVKYQSYSLINKTMEHYRRSLTDKFSAEDVHSFFNDIINSFMNNADGHKRLPSKKKQGQSQHKNKNMPPAKFPTHQIKNHEITDPTNIKNPIMGDLFTKSITSKQHNAAMSATWNSQGVEKKTLPRSWQSQKEIASTNKRHGNTVTNSCGSQSIRKGSRSARHLATLALPSARYAEATKNCYQNILQKSKLDQLEDIIIRKKAHRYVRPSSEKNEQIQLSSRRVNCNKESSSISKGMVQKSVSNLTSFEERNVSKNKSMSNLTNFEERILSKYKSVSNLTNFEERNVFKNKIEEDLKEKKLRDSYDLPSMMMDMDVVEFGGYVFVGVDQFRVTKSKSCIDSEYLNNLLIFDIEEENKIQDNLMFTSDINKDSSVLSDYKKNIEDKGTQPPRHNDDKSDYNQVIPCCNCSEEQPSEKLGNTSISLMQNDLKADVKYTLLESRKPKNIPSVALHSSLTTRKPKNIPSVALHSSLTTPTWSQAQNGEFHIHNQIMRHLSEGSNLTAQNKKHRLGIRDRRMHSPPQPQTVIRSFLEALLNKLPEIFPENKQCLVSRIEDGAYSMVSNQGDYTLSTTFLDKVESLLSETEETETSYSGGSFITTFPSLSGIASSSGAESTISASLMEASDLSVCFINEDIIMPEISFLEDGNSQKRAEIKQNIGDFETSIEYSELTPQKSTLSLSVISKKSFDSESSEEGNFTNDVQIKVINDGNAIIISIIAEKPSQAILSTDISGSKSVTVYGPKPVTSDLTLITEKQELYFAKIMHYPTEVCIKTDWEVTSEIGTCDMKDCETLLINPVESSLESSGEQLISYEMQSPQLPLEVVPAISYEGCSELSLRDLTTPDTFKDLLPAFSYTSNETSSSNFYCDCDNVEQFLEKLNNITSTVLKEVESYRSDMSSLEDYLDNIVLPSKGDDRIAVSRELIGVEAVASEVPQTRESKEDYHSISYFLREDGVCNMERSASHFEDELDTISETTSDDASLIALQNQVLENYIPDENTTNALEHVLHTVLETQTTSNAPCKETVSSKVPCSSIWKLEEKTALIEDYILKIRNILKLDELLKNKLFMPKHAIAIDSTSAQKLVRRLTEELALISQEEMEEYMTQVFGEELAQQILYRKKGSHTYHEESGFFELPSFKEAVNLSETKEIADHLEALGDISEVDIPMDVKHTATTVATINSEEIVKELDVSDENMTDDTTGTAAESSEDVFMLHSVLNSDEQLLSGAGDGAQNTRNLTQQNETQFMWSMVSLDDIVRLGHSNHHLNTQSSSLSVVVTKSVADQSTISNNSPVVTPLENDTDNRNNSLPTLNKYLPDDLERSLIDNYTNFLAMNSVSSRDIITEKGKFSRRTQALVTVYLILFSVVFGSLSLPTHCE